ncbi:uncharacterized protein N7483_007985 [Penicillium malachiteum]|uniref:uncharacterized protein n=1 Tax=Penicillium malachiteum TaxID=1324776 RepID=UPI0025487C9B|nr:uncharacterized protein N7483_007985 [Penicillium malachiteum]KAJ5726628.1 hypothetical protein N7483_007985 [Penicillium malachiteum]
MSTLDQLNSVHGLPDSVPRYTYQGLRYFNRILDFEIERLGLVSGGEPKKDAEGNPLDTPVKFRKDFEKTKGRVWTDYIIFSIDYDTFYRDFDYEADPVYHTRFTFLPEINALVVQLNGYPEFSQIVSMLPCYISNALDPMDQLKTRRGIGCVGGTTWRMGNGGIKEASSSWLRYSPPRTQLPDRVLEVSVSGKYTKLLRDVDQWLDPANGNVNIALIALVDHLKPFIALERWEYDHQNARPRKMQRIEIKKSESSDEFSGESSNEYDKSLEAIEVSGSPLILPFNILFGRDQIQTSQMKPIRRYQKKA